MITIAGANRLAAFEDGGGRAAGRAVVSEDGKSGDADADETGGDFCCTVSGNWVSGGCLDAG